MEAEAVQPTGRPGPYQCARRTGARCFIQRLETELAAVPSGGDHQQIQAALADIVSLLLVLRDFARGDPPAAGTAI
jgi:hypothetical protein